MTGEDNARLVSRSTSALSLLRLGSSWAEIMGLSPAWGAMILCYDFELLTVDSRAVYQDIYIDHTMISVLSRYCPYSDAELLGGFPHILPCLKVKWLIAARSREEADIGGNGMVVMLFLKKPLERRDEASLGWCWHHLIIRSDVNLRLHSIHTDTTASNEGPHEDS